ncbi:PP2C family serine/threonine-protein phosphatase [Bacillus suaedaesalsae]|uniref:SpoIIE family protein phosphatase n=1 Tax=Bacillus suaedaesalsae TaxID=2810349 RepID=A0ABS2DGT5_9BACI|nr:PP2C family serine/threonine-protein phosphatase [Bacillus suaedaesalsae]MBM6617690.1 SpoIIE family protein phosphatase [Bacillus suaedaesalsae]
MNEEVVTENLELYITQRSKVGQSSCGDSYITLLDDDYAVIALADGLGSGELAKESSIEVVNTIRQFHNEDVRSLFIRCNQALKTKRGVALAIAKVYYTRNEIVYSCIGNIRFTIISPTGKSTFPLPKVGYLSGKPVTPNIHRFSYDPCSVFVMNSDGVKATSTRELTVLQNSLPDMLTYLERNITTKDDATLLVGKIKQ